MLITPIFRGLGSNYNIEAFNPLAGDSDWLDFSIIRDTLPEEKPSVESIEILTFKDSVYK